jgi:5-methylcytosine-specific restriction endonuclease McrA
MGQRCKQCGIIKSAKSRTRLDLTDEDRHRRILGYNHFIDTVRKRDNYKCQICEHQGKRWDGSLHVHHIESFLKNKELRLDINNGITLCKKCHRKFHNKYGIKNNNEKQFNEFLLIEKGV